MTKPKEKTRLQTITVHETELIAWREAGWDLAEMDDGRDDWWVLEWRAGGRPTIPTGADAEDKKLLNAVAALEGRVV
jgi:hypothetical protein